MEGEGRRGKINWFNFAAEKEEEEREGEIKKLPQSPSSQPAFSRNRIFEITF